jgi:uncharacterized protein (UPF0276 family)
MINNLIKKTTAAIIILIGGTIATASEAVKLTKEELQIVQNLINKKIIVKNPQTHTLDLNEALKQKDLIRDLESINAQNCTGDGPPIQ